MINFLFYVEGVFSITGRGRVASVKGIWYDKKPRKGKVAYIVPCVYGKPLQEFVIWGVEEYCVGGGIPAGIGIPDNLNVVKGDFIVG